MMRRLLAVLSVVLMMSLAACGSGVATGTEKPDTDQVRVTGRVVTINVPDATDSYVAFEVKEDESPDVVARYCSFGQPVCRLLKVGDRVSFIASKNSVFASYLVRIPQ